MAISASWKPMATSSTDERCPGGLVSCKKEHMFSCLAGSILFLQEWYSNFLCNLDAEPKQSYEERQCIFLINWHWNFTFLSCILVAWPSYLVILLVQIFFHQEFLGVSSGYCEKLLVHSDFSPDVALSQTVVPPGLCSEFLLPLETKVWYTDTSVHDLENNITFVITNFVAVNIVWQRGRASESQVNKTEGDARFQPLRNPCGFTEWVVHESIIHPTKTPWLLTSRQATLQAFKSNTEIQVKACFADDRSKCSLWRVLRLLRKPFTVASRRGHCFLLHLSWQQRLQNCILYSF